jgi:RNA polymerase sigma-70 factor (ECF subfamily)
VEVAEADFARWVEERRSPETDLDGVHTRDLYLACACSRGDATALGAFDTAYARTIDAALASLRMRDEHGDDVRQRLRTKLFVGAQPKIGGYRGGGELGAWVRAAAIREALDLRRSQRHDIPTEDPLAAIDAVPLADPALAALKQQYRVPMKAAFVAALAELPKADRALLRYKYSDGATLDELAQIQRVHRATIARKLRELRDQLAERTRAHLMAELRVDASDAESIIRLVQSQLAASLPGLDER